MCIRFKAESKRRKFRRNLQVLRPSGNGTDAGHQFFYRKWLDQGIICSGVQSIDGGQSEAARSLGLRQTQNLRYIIFPQALKNILPAIANEFVVIIKESAITWTIGVQDIMSAVNAVKGATSIIMEPLLVATALYFCLCFPTSKIIAYFERRMSRGDKR